MGDLSRGDITETDGQARLNDLGDSESKGRETLTGRRDDGSD